FALVTCVDYAFANSSIDRLPEADILVSEDLSSHTKGKRTESSCMLYGCF
ncbi:Hypothetical predicted protein, partial [Podarcis lilfordi]